MTASSAATVAGTAGGHTLAPRVLADGATFVLPEAVLCDGHHEANWPALRGFPIGYVAEIEQTRSFDLYVDSVTGSDSNDGKTRGSPVATLARMLALAARGFRIGLKAGSRFHEKLIDFGLVDLRIGRYDAGSDPIVDGSRAIAANAWTADSRAHVFRAEIDHLEVPPLSGSLQAHAAHYGLWYEKNGISVGLTAYYSGGDQAANRDYVHDHPGTFTANVRGSAAADPRINNAEANPKQLSYYAHFPSSVDPTMDGGAAFYVDPETILQMASGLALDGVAFQRNLSKDLVIQADKESGVIRGATFREAAGHGWLGSPARLYGITSSGRRESAAVYGGGGIHFFRAAETVGTARKETSATRCAVAGFTVGFYSHGNGPTDEHERVDIRDCSATDCATAIQNGQTTKGWFVDRFSAVRCTNFAIAESYLLIKNTRWWSGAGDGGFLVGLQFYAGAEIVLENCALIFDGGVAAHFRYLFRNNSGDAARSKLRFINCTIVNGRMGTVQPKHKWLDVDLALENTILGNLEGADPFFHNIGAVNSQFSVGGKTMAQIRAAWPEVTGNCLEAAANPAVFVTAPDAPPYDVALNPACSVALAGMGCDQSLLPA